MAWRCLWMGMIERLNTIFYKICIVSSLPMCLYDLVVAYSDGLNIKLSIYVFLFGVCIISLMWLISKLTSHKGIALFISSIIVIGIYNMILIQLSSSIDATLIWVFAIPLQTFAGYIGFIHGKNNKASKKTNGSLGAILSMGSSIIIAPSYLLFRYAVPSNIMFIFCLIFIIYISMVWDYFLLRIVTMLHYKIA